MTFPTGQKVLNVTNAGATQIQLVTSGPYDCAIPATFGQFTLNGATPVTVAAVNTTATSMILIGLDTVGGSVGAIPVIQTKTAGVGFTVLGTAGDTSTYTYLIIA